MCSENKQNLPLEDHLCFAAYAASHAIQQRYREHLSQWGITYPQYLVLVTLWDAQEGVTQETDAQETSAQADVTQPATQNASETENAGLTVSEIGQRLYLDSGTLSPLLKRLEAAEFIRKQRSAEDNRRVTIHPTPKALELRGKVGVLLDCLLADAQLTPEEMRTLRELSSKIARNLRASQ